MLEYREFNAPLLVHAVTPSGPIPTICDPEGLYPYESFVETSRRPQLQSHRFIVLENERLRVTICPDLGGKVYSLYDKVAGHEVLFVPASIKPVRILPRLGFIPGGIEVSFPIAHTPVQLEPVAAVIHRAGDRLYAWCGERELRFGLQWTVEWSLGENDSFLTQRTCFANPTGSPHPWMSWSNAALPARADTQFHFPDGQVLRHGERLEQIDWATQGPRTVAGVHSMTGFFWLRPGVCAFGAFTPSLGHGLFHVAEAAAAPGIKLWTYGHGADERWGQAASLSGETYIEIQGGPQADQSIKDTLAPGERRHHVEFWFPTAAPLELDELRLPTPELLPVDQAPAFDWPPRESVRRWVCVLEAHRARLAERLPPPPGIDENHWAPSGMDDLGEALGWAASVNSSGSSDTWLFHLGAWQAARNEVETALATLARSTDERARLLAGRLHLRVRQDPAAAVHALRAIRVEALTLHPQVMIERDLALAALGPATLAERAAWLERLLRCTDEWLLERRAAWLADAGRLDEARELLERTPFQLVHQRYERTRLWRDLQRASATPGSTPPASLGEDNLAAFGAYRDFAG
jgi:hypothetical protein